jgi:hypothetical protein
MRFVGIKSYHGVEIGKYVGASYFSLHVRIVNERVKKLRNEIRKIQKCVTSVV